MIRMTPNVSGGATFSSCNQYRYVLTRTWDEGGPPLAFVMLNPSTADAKKNDPTVERCQRRAQRGTYGGLIVLNLFALRSTDPLALYTHKEPIGEGNDGFIAHMVSKAGDVVCAWGNHGEIGDRGAAVYEIIRKIVRQPLCLGVNASGHPKHPLYVAYDRPFVPYDGPSK